MFDAQALAQPAVRALRAYDPGHDIVALRDAHRGLVELGSNENPYGPSPAAKQAVLETINQLHRYPDPLGGRLKRALAARHGVDPAGIVLGNGSHELLMQLAQAFAGPGRGVVASRYGFAVYAIAAQAVGAPLRLAEALPGDAGMPHGHDLDALLAAIVADTAIVYLCNPNNPTGTWFSGDALDAFLARVPEDVLVVVDEAYAEFADAPDYRSAVGLLPRHRNLVVARTFSKAHALAGLRIGCVLCDPALAAVLERLRESFNVNLAGLAAAQAALADEAHLRWSLAGNAQQRTQLAQALATRGWKVAPSMTNFLLVDFGEACAAIEDGLLAAGVVLRPMRGYGLPSCLRITVGDASENRALLAALDALR